MDGFDAQTGPAPESASPTPEGGWSEFARTWLAQMEDSEKRRKDFIRRGRRITKRYRSAQDRNDAARAGSKFNIFWSNVQTLAPATYSRRPKVQVSRRFRDADPIGRLASQILERALQYEVDCGLNFHHTMQRVVLDRLLPGEGVAWVRYEPTFQSQQMPPLPGQEPQSVDVIQDEKTPVDYVFWEDFHYSKARTWADVTWVGRWVPFTKEALVKRFGESAPKFGGDASKVPVNYDPAKQNAENESSVSSREDDVGEEDKFSRRALVAEIWNKDKKQVIFVAKGYEFPLDVRDDPAKLEDFWPCPPPLVATTTNDETTPVADFIIYQEQLRELDTITNRISLLTSALKVIGVYDSSQESMKDMLQAGQENKLIPVDSWGAFAERGGLKGTMELLPLETVAEVLKGLHDERDRVKQTIYEITGMSDIIRGASMASETLGAQEIKAKFANLRLSDRQKQCAEFVTRVLQIKAELMCEFYTPDTLIRISSATQIEEVRLHPERLQQAIGLLKQDKARQYRIEVEAGSLVELDEVDENKRRNEFMGSVANFMNALKNIAGIAPEMFPVAMEMLKFVVRGFPIGRGLESAIEDASEAIRKRLANPQPPKPDPTEMAKLQSTQALEDKRQQGENYRAQLEADTMLKVEGMKIGQETFLDAIGKQHEAAMASMDLLHQRMQAQLDREQANRQVEQQMQQERHQQMLDRMHEAVQAMQERQHQAQQAAADRNAAMQESQEQRAHEAKENQSDRVAAVEQAEAAAPKGAPK